jgi:hypothetical protein
LNKLSSNKYQVVSLYILHPATDYGAFTFANFAAQKMPVTATEALLSLGSLADMTQIGLFLSVFIGQGSQGK